MRLIAMLLLLGLVACGGCGGGGGNGGGDQPVLLGEDAEGRQLYDTNKNGKADIACGGRGGDVNVVNTGDGNVSNSGNAGDGGNCVSISEGDQNDGGNAGDSQDNSSEETTTEGGAV